MLAITTFIGVDIYKHPAGDQKVYVLTAGFNKSAKIFLVFSRRRFGGIYDDK